VVEFWITLMLFSPIKVPSPTRSHFLLVFHVHPVFAYVFRQIRFTFFPIFILLFLVLRII